MGDEDGAASTRCHIGSLLDRQQCDLGIEFDELLNDDHWGVSSHAGRLFPAFLEIPLVWPRTGLSRWNHHRLDHTGSPTFDVQPINSASEEA